MNFKPSIFTIISAISCMSFIDNAMADSCDGKGWYVYDSSPDWCMPCPAGCYCDGNAEKNKYSQTQWLKCSSGLEKYGIYQCGSGWTSDSTTQMCTGLGKHSYCRGPQSRQDCYFTAKDSGKKIYKGSTDIKCAPGTYVKAGYANCQSCKTGYICPGGIFQVPNEKKLRQGVHDYEDVRAGSTWSSNWKIVPRTLYRSPSTDDGIYLCPSGTVANSNHTKCQSGNTYCAAGKYLPKNATTCSSCKDRYYCPGGSFPKASYDQGLKTCPSGQKPDALQKSCIKDTSTSSSSSNGSIKCYAGQYLPANATSCSPCKNRYYCLGGTFSKSSSDQGLKTCMFSEPNYSKTACQVKCDKGKYLPANGWECQSCKDRYYCWGGTFSQHVPYDQGTRQIGGSSTTNSNGGGSTSTSTQRVYCNPGRYLPANGKETADCRQCKERYYCIGGTFPVASYDQGLRSCPANSAPVLPDRTKCEYGAFECEPGYYMRAKGTGCTKCPTTKNYCPGGTYKPNDVDQGIKVCPDLTVANDKRSACKMTITKQQLQYGLAKKTDAAIEEQCWTRATMPEYVYCMFGGKVNIKIKEEPAPASTDSGTDTGTDTGDSAKTE